MYEGSAFRYFGLQKHEIWVIWKGKCNAWLEKTLYYTDFWAKNDTPSDTIVSKGVTVMVRATGLEPARKSIGT